MTSIDFPNRLPRDAKTIRQTRAGIALVIILCAIVLISILVSVFLGHAMLSRQMSQASVGQSRAENIADVGLETVLGDLRSEIVAGSTRSAASPAIYQPSTNFTVVPARVAADGLTNVVKRSAGGSNFWSGPGYSADIAAPARASAGLSTTNASRNGRSVKRERWNAPYLLGPNVPSGFQPPDWVMVMRSGPATNGAALPTIAVLADQKPNNTNCAIGRFAYMIYDEGGLLDVTTAGFPNGVNPDFTSKRGLLPQVDLAAIPGIGDARALVAWRNTASRANYAEYVFSSTTGLTEVAPGDQTFVSRQDLIRYQKSHPDQLTAEALQYLGTHIRDVNAPTYHPPGNRPKTGAVDDQFNPSLLDVRVTAPFTRASDGQLAAVGEPLLKYRFPLDRLSLFSRSDAEAAEKIETYFGLRRAAPGSPWVYRGGALSILKLSEVAAAGREPDFFELLQAGIAYGSLGANLPKQGSNTTSYDRNTYYQVAQIAANLIDQFDADSYPTRMKFGAYPYDFSGIENLPYLTRFFETIYRYAGSNVVGVWYQPEVWNPHASATAGANAPSSFRFRMSGRAAATVKVGSSNNTIYSLGPRSLESSPGITFDLSKTQFPEPQLLSPDVGADASGLDKVADGANTFLGINIGTATIPAGEFRYTVPGSSYAGAPQTPLEFELQYFDPITNAFVTYDRIRAVDSGVGIYVAGHNSIDTPHARSYMVRSDPRSDRFGVFIGANGPSSGETIRPTAAPGRMYGTGFEIGTFSENRQTSATPYADPDGTVRPGDGKYAGAAGLSGYPLATGNTASRPIVLNRPFRSVGDMAYASRGGPWKHLDFFSDTSGDKALLDLFCVSKPAMHQTETVPLEAGRINLNSRQHAVLSAILEGAIKAEDTSSVLSAAEADAFASELLGLTQGTRGPLVNKADLVAPWLASLSSGSADSIIKRRKESLIRALADSGTTRTWNLLIDLVAQSGRFPSAASNLNQFMVEGERRYWLHVTIDRFTGVIVARSLEAVAD